ncbi:hypothetical protein HDU86_000538 [Geranomyces michiganensis]|nr:hypothetical protein HDU86_000538 [Geranomyces michiganensis]
MDFGLLRSAKLFLALSLSSFKSKAYKAQRALERNADRAAAAGLFIADNDTTASDGPSTAAGGLAAGDGNVNKTSLGPMGRRKSSSTVKAAAADPSATDKGASRVAIAAAESTKDRSQGNHVTQQSTVLNEQMSFLATLQTESVTNLAHLPYDLMAASAPEDNGGWDALLGALTTTPGTPQGGVFGSVSSEGSSPFSSAPAAHANGPSTSVWPCSPYSSSPEQQAGSNAFANVLSEACGSGASGAFEHVGRTFAGNGQPQPPPRRCVCHVTDASSALMTPAPSPVIRPQANGISVDSGVLSLLLNSYIGNLLSPGGPSTVAAAAHASKQNPFPAGGENRLPWFQEAAGFGGYQRHGGPPTPPADLSSQHCQQEVHRLYNELAPLTSDLRSNTTTAADVARDLSAGWTYDLPVVPNSGGGLLLGSSMSAPSGAGSSVADSHHLSARHQPRPPQAPPPLQASPPLLDLARPGGAADIARLSDSALEQVLSNALLQYQLRSTTRGEGAGGGGGGARGGGGAGGDQFLAQQLYPHQQRAQEQRY